MAITRLMQAGAESGSLLELDSTGGAGASIVTSGQKTGARAFQASNAGANTSYFLQNIPATRQIRKGCYHQITLFNTTSPYLTFLSIRSAGGELIGLQYTSVGNNLSLMIAGVAQATIPGYTLNVLRHVAIDINIDASAGWAKVYIDGVLQLSFEGNTGNADIITDWFGKIAGSGGTGTVTYIFDDIYIDDTTGEAATAPPVLRFYYVTPNANGNYSQWDGSDGNQVDNYLLIDEIPPNSDTDYVETNVVDELDSYNMTTITLEAGQQVEAIIPFAFVKRAGSTEEIALGTRLSGTDAVGSDQAPTTSYNFLWERQTTKPGGGAWAQADIDGFETVLKSRGSY